jgi:uncharacterized membrane protein
VEPEPFFEKAAMPSSHLQYLPIPWPIYVLLLGALAIIAALIQIGLIRYVYTRLGISPLSALLLLLASLFGAYVNIPIAQLQGQTEVVGRRVDYFGFEYVVPTEVDWPGTIIAINLGGAVIPIALSLYLLFKNSIWLPAFIATVVVSAVCYAVAEPVRGAGIAIPIFIPPLVACAVSCIVAWSQAAPVAYVSGSLGTLIGADLMNFSAIRDLGTPVASIGGAGTFDGIFVTGIVAVVLASIIGAIGARRAHPGPA